MARLATSDREGRPHCIPVVFAWNGREALVPLDGKPKRVPVQRLRRVRNVLENPRAVLLVDVYDEDWSRLRWLMVECDAAVTPPDEASLALLREKYAQYERVPVEGLIRLAPTRVVGWQAGPL